MPAEIERKFLLAEVPHDVARQEPQRILQGYLAMAGDGTEVRVRRRGHASSLTVKSGTGLVRDETEIELTAEQFDALWPLAATASIRKSRFLVTLADLAVEIDRFEGQLAGLVLAEIEFRSEEQARAFIPPSWFGREVTGDLRFTNAHLAKAPSPPSDPSHETPVPPWSDTHSA